MFVVLTGGSSGLGLAIKSRLRVVMPDIRIADLSLETGKDVSLEDDAYTAAREISAHTHKVDVLINCAGYNYLNWIPEIPGDEWDKVLGANAKAIFLTAKYFCHILRGGTICNIVSNASHMPMTHSLAYNASKGAAEIMTRQMAKELWVSHGIIVFGVSPNKLKNTGMTEKVDKRAADLHGMTTQQAKAYQLGKMLLQEETDPDCVAEFIVWLLEQRRRHFYLAGSVLEYGV